ncbi:MAG: DNA repair protein RadC [Pseudomonadota bacterium]
MQKKVQTDLESRLFHCGPQRLTTAELVAIVVGTASADGPSTWLARFGGLRRLCRAEVAALDEFGGIDGRRSAALRALPELFRRYADETLPAGETLASPADTREFLTVRLRDKPYEVFCCLYLDNRHRVIRFEELFRGTIDGASVYPREVVRAALAVNAAAVILAHNHPSGVAEPSTADELLTKRLIRALALIDIRLLDHMIVGERGCVSLAERGGL